MYTQLVSVTSFVPLAPYLTRKHVYVWVCMCACLYVCVYVRTVAAALTVSANSIASQVGLALVYGAVDRGSVASLLALFLAPPAATQLQPRLYRFLYACQFV